MALIGGALYTDTFIEDLNFPFGEGFYYSKAVQGGVESESVSQLVPGL